MKRILLTCAALAVFCAAAQAQDWSQATRAVAELAASAQRHATETRGLIQQEKAKLATEKAGLQASIDTRRKRFEALKAAFQKLADTEQTLRDDLAAQAHELKTMDGAVRTAAKQARDYFHESLTTPENPRRLEVLSRVLTPDTFPGFTGIRDLASLYLEEMHSARAVVRRLGEFLAEDGRPAQGELVRIGAFTAAYRDKAGTLGFLRPTADGRTLEAVPGRPGWSLSGLMNDFMDGKGQVFPVDISNGAALARLAQEQKSLTEWLLSGGPLVWPILLVGLAALALVCERFYVLSRVRGNSDGNMDRILELVEEEQWDDCRAFCKTQGTFPTCRIIGHTLAHLGNTRQVVEDAFQEGLLKELPRLERFLPTLGVLAAVAPLLGLLGTVTGMINTFQIITLYGTGDPRMMSGGISEALITTQLGLAVAVPIMLLHHILERRVDKIVGDMEEKGASLSVALMRKGQMNGGLDAAA